MTGRKKTFCCIAIVMLAISGCGLEEQTAQQKQTIQPKVVTADDIKKENCISADADYVVYDYEGLKDRAVSIVKAEVTDELTSENSLSEYDEEMQGTVQFCSVRRVKILAVYKSSGLSVGDEILVQDTSAIYEENGEYYQNTKDDTPPLDKGSQYILYLGSNDTMSGQPAIISCGNGRVNLTEEEQNKKFYDIAVKSVAEYESNQPELVTTDDIKKENVISVPADNVLFDYNELKDNSDMIVKAEVLDELTSANSMTDYDEELQAVVGSCSVRQIRILEVYKDVTGALTAGDEIGVQDISAIYEENGEYYQETYNETPPLKKGDRYLLYMDTGNTMSGKPSISEQGRVNLTEEEQNKKFYDIAVKSITEYAGGL